MNKSNQLLTSFLFLFTILSCSSEEETSGCTDALAQNFDPNATISTACTYLSDPYLGSYNLSISDCTRDQELFDNATAFIQAENTDPNDVMLILNGISGQPIQFVGEISDGSIIFNSTDDAFGSRGVEGLQYGNNTFIFPRFTLRGTLAGSTTQLSGSMAISAVNADDNDAQIFSTNCDFLLSK